MYSKDSQAFCFHYVSQKTSPPWTWNRGSSQGHPSCAVSSTHFNRARLPVLDGFPGMGEAHRDDPQLEGLDSSASLLFLLCTGLSHVYLILTTCSEVPAGYKYSINVSYPDDLRERASRDWGYQGREMKGCHKETLNAQQCDLPFILQKVWRSLEKGLEG